MQGLEHSNGNEIVIESTCERPMPLQEGIDGNLLAATSPNEASGLR